jgi:hypothetical protein
MACDARPNGRDRLRGCLLAFGPWLVLYFSVQAKGPPRHPLFVGLPFERSWPVLEWTEILYVSGYLFTPLAPLLAPTRAALRQFVVTGLVATLVVGVLWLLVPVVAVPRPFVPETFWGRLLAAERSWSVHVAAFPSFHALWALIAADALWPRSRRWAAVAWSWAVLITLSCATTGQHAVLDLAAAALLFLPLRRAGAALSSRVAAPGWPTLRLHKWYLDCTTEHGEAAIVYVGRVTLGCLPVPYFELLSVGPGGVRRWRRLSSRPRVWRDGETLRLAVPALGLLGRWEPTTAALDIPLLEAPGGTIRWRCHQPGGPSEVQLPDGRRLVGSGYAEELEMSLPPWALPFQELRWGRFTGSGRSVVWIDWRGGLERRWLFVDGEPVEAQRIEVDRVRWATGRLDIQTGIVVREARIGRTLAGPLARLLPRRLGQALETKWLCPARLHVGEAALPIHGSVIHEVVRWA